MSLELRWRITYIIRKLKKKWTVYSRFKDKIWGIALADIQLISKFNRRFTFLLCVFDFLGKYAWVAPLKNKEKFTNTNAFQKILKQSNRKPGKIWVDKGSKFYNSSFEKWLKDNDIEMYSIYQEGKSVVADRTIRTKIYKYTTSTSKNVYIDKLDDNLNKYNNTYNNN